MELISTEAAFPFMRNRFIAFAGSLLLIALSIFTWASTGNEKFGVDFLGGTEIVVEFARDVPIGDVRKALNDAKIDGAIVQAFEGHLREFSIRIKADKSQDTGKRIRSALQVIEGGSVELLKEDYVGPIIGDQIRKDGLTALVIALIGILIYISVRFEFRFAVGAVIALVHDVIITTGIFVFTGREISAGVLAALLTIIGYSLNDTIIVYDRVRESLTEAIKKAKGKIADVSLPDIVDHSITRTLSRTLLTSGTTLIVVVALWLLGGGAVVDLAFSLVVGIIVGTYSSIFIACPVVLAWSKK